MSEYDPNYIPIYARFLIGVKIIITNHNGDILLLKRSDKTSRPHGWDFPGGGVDKGEDPLTAAIREVQEETSIMITSPILLHISHGEMDAGEYLIIGYSAKAANNEVTISWEHEDYAWMIISEVSQLLLPDVHKAIFEKYVKSLH